MMRIPIVILMVIMAFQHAAAATTSVKVTQAANGWFKIHDDTVVLAVEEFQKPLRLQIMGNNRKVMYSRNFSEDFPTQNEFSFVNPFLRFKILNIKGLPSPIILAVAAYPSASDIGYDLDLIAEKQGEITSINPQPLLLSIQDGIYLGYISKKYGYGMITWKFQFDAAHYAPHKYKISIYHWDNEAESFAAKKTFITKKRFESGEDALRHYGLPTENFRNVVMLPEQEMSTLGIEAEFLYTTETDSKQSHNPLK